MFKQKFEIADQPTQQEKIAEIGAYLQQKREEQGLSLEVVSEKTLIQLRLLKAIELGNLETLPEPVYIRGLIKQFADTLNLNGTELAHSFPTEVETQQKQWTWTIRLPSFQLRPFHLYFLYIAIIIFAVRGISHSIQQSAWQGNPQIDTKPVAVPVTPAKSPASKAQPVSQPTANVKKAPDKPVMVQIQLKDQSWLKVVVDGKTEFEGVLPQGSQRTWTANQQLTIRSGNAGGVLVTFNQEEAKQLGKPGQVEEITYQAKAN